MTDFWEAFSWQVYLLSEFLTEIYWEHVAEEIIFYIFVLMSDREFVTVALRLINQHTTDPIASIKLEIIHLFSG